MEKIDELSLLTHGVINSISNIRDTELYKSNLLGKNDKEKAAVISNVLNSIDVKYIHKTYCNKNGAHGTFRFSKRYLAKRKVLLRGDGSFSELIHIIESFHYRLNRYVDSHDYYVERFSRIKILDTIPEEALVRKWALWNALCEYAHVEDDKSRAFFGELIDNMFIGTDMKDNQFDFIIEHWFKRDICGCHSNVEQFKFVNRIEHYELTDERFRGKLSNLEVYKDGFVIKFKLDDGGESNETMMFDDVLRKLGMED